MTTQSPSEYYIQRLIHEPNFEERPVLRQLVKLWRRREEQEKPAPCND